MLDIKRYVDMITGVNSKASIEVHTLIFAG